MKKLKLVKENELSVSIDESIYCDFCGELEVDAFTSSYEVMDAPDRSTMQICFDCVKQLHKIIPQ
jgi:hypothetical protein